nr:ubiquilin 1 [Hymenolepis microstoma]
MSDISLKLKAPNNEKSVTVKGDGTVKDLRAEAAKAFEVPPARVCLIYAGKILKDENSLSEHKIHDGLTIHVVIRQEQNPGVQGGSSATTTSANPTSTSTSQNRPTGAFDPLSTQAASIFGSGGANTSSFASMQQQMQQQVMRNPELLRNVMDSPLVQSLMSNPEVMRSIMQSNPQMREIMERNPELGQMLTNPEILRQSMEIASNPALVQEMMRSYDRAVLNLESIPGGSGHLQRIYQDVQEPMLNALHGGDNNPFADLAGSTNRTAAPSNEPMPNPWAPQQPQSETNISVSGTTGTTGTSTGNESSTTTNPTGVSLLGGLPFNPEAISSAFQAPYVRSMLESMASSPETFEAFLSANPLWNSGNLEPASREQMRRMLPQLARQMSRPGFVSMLSNPRAMSAMAQIQEGLRVLQQEAPEVFASMTNLSNATGISGLFSGATESAGSTEVAQAESGTTTAAPTSGNAGSAELATLMASLLNVAPSSQDSAASQLPPEERYNAQLQTLANMGFENRTANLQALILSHGDVNAAVDRLLDQGH